MFFFHLPAGIQQYDTSKNIEFIKYGMEHSVTQFKSWINVRNMTANLSFKTFQWPIKSKKESNSLYVNVSLLFNISRC